MPSRDAIQTSDAPAAIGPYVQAIRTGDLLFCSGQIPLDPATGELVGTTAAEQAEQCLKNLVAIIEAAGGSLGDAVKCTIYMTDLDEFGNVNEVYDRFVGNPAPARVTVGVAALPKGALVEIDAIVALG